MHCAVYDPATNKIIAFFKNGIRAGLNFAGDDMRMTGLSLEGLAVKWTADLAEPIRDETGAITGWSKPADQLAEAATDRDIGIVDRSDLLARLDHLRDMARITDSQIEARVALITDLPSARTYLERLTKETRDILRVALWILKGKL